MNFDMRKDFDDLCKKWGFELSDIQRITHGFFYSFGRENQADSLAKPEPHDSLLADAPSDDEILKALYKIDALAINYDEQQYGLPLHITDGQDYNKAMITVIRMLIARRFS